MTRHATALAVLLLLPAPAQDPAPPDASSELRAMYEADQAARSGDFDSLTPADIDRIAAEDEQRRARVLEILKEGQLASGDDHFHAAMILQHGDAPADYALAHALATIAAFEGHPNGKWLAAASLDRLLQKVGEAQLFGTQYRLIDGAWTMDPISDVLPDSVRAAHGVPPLAQAKVRLAEMNGK